MQLFCANQPTEYPLQSRLSRLASRNQPQSSDGCHGHQADEDDGKEGGAVADHVPRSQGGVEEHHVVVPEGGLLHGRAVV